MLKLNNEEPLRAEIEPPEVFLSVIVPAYNEENRLSKMLADAVNYLESTYPLSESSLPHTSFPPRSNSSKKLQASTPTARSRSNSRSRTGGPLPGGWEILIVSDGSTDATVDTALAFATSLPSDSPARAAIRVVALHRNRGKGGAVLHGLRHARGAYAVFADADGATRFRDVSKLLAVCRVGEDAQGRAVVVGSRAHLQKKKEKREKAKARSAQANGSAGEQGRRRSSSGSGGSDAVVERSWFRTFLMRSFHVFLWLLTPRATGRIRDTQCGFKLFSRAALRDIVPYMHCEGWIFDVEMLMLAEAAGIAVAEVPVTWREVLGSKLNVVRDSLGMAYGLGMLRAAWALGVYKRTWLVCAKVSTAWTGNRALTALIGSWLEEHWLS